MSGNATTIALQDGDEELACADASHLLGVPPEALARWSRELAFPSNVGDEHAPRYRRSELEALRATLVNAHSVEGAIREAREQVSGSQHS